MTFPSSPRHLTRWLAAAAGLFLIVWLLFLDSHSVMKRVRWHQQEAQLTQENERLRAEIDALDAKLEEPPSDALIERIAREQYGMRRPGETVYRIEKDDSE